MDSLKLKNKYYVGCSGFAESYWKGIFYPEDLSAKDYLNFYAEYLNAVEINSTFYRKPRVSTLENWVAQTGPSFKFFIKIPKTISHIKKLEDTKAETAEFCQYISDHLKDKLGGFLFQLPPSFKFTKENLQKVLDTVDNLCLNVVEFRHHSWWTKEIQDVLNERSIVFSGVSIPKNIPNDFMINNSEFAYYRLHGVPDQFKSEYSENELESLATEIQKFEGTSYVFFNNTFGTAAIKNALGLQRILKI